MPEIRELIPVQPPEEQALLVGAPRKGSPDAAALDRHLDELDRLADTAGAVVVGRLSQRVEAPDPAHYLGRGKLEELATRAGELGATLIIFDEELSPGQGHNLEKVLGLRVMDRAELILDIFATRARSREARMQVELAQLQYLLPRLQRMWTHLSRIRGGIGLRGPGETQLETDRRIISRRISRLRRELRDVAAHRENLRRGRDPMLQVALVGYTNAGKSSLLNALAGSAEAFVEDRLFATLDTLTREVELGEGYHARVSDTVGFIRKLPHHLVASFRATFEEGAEADALIHVIDASHSDYEAQIEVVERVLADLGLGARPTLLAFTKMDRVAVPAEFLAAAARRYARVVGVSAVEPSGAAPWSGADALRAALREIARESRATARVAVPVGDGALRAMLHREAEVLAEVQADGLILVTARVTPPLLGRLRRQGIEVVVGQART